MDLIWNGKFKFKKILTKKYVICKLWYSPREAHLRPTFYNFVKTNLSAFSWYKNIFYIFVRSNFRLDSKKKCQKKVKSEFQQSFWDSAFDGSKSWFLCCTYFCMYILIKKSCKKMFYTERKLWYWIFESLKKWG